MALGLATSRLPRATMARPRAIRLCVPLLRFTACAILGAIFCDILQCSSAIRSLSVRVIAIVSRSPGLTPFPPSHSLMFALALGFSLLFRYFSLCPTLCSCFSPLSLLLLLASFSAPASRLSLCSCFSPLSLLLLLASFSAPASRLFLCSCFSPRSRPAYVTMKRMMK